MNSQSYKRKRVDVQHPISEAASSIYERLGVDILTTSNTSGKFEEVEPPRKRYIQAASQAVFHNIGSTPTAGRVAPNGVAKSLLSNEQIQQFITSTVLPNGRSVTSTEAVNLNVTNCTVYPSQPRTRIQQQILPTNVEVQGFIPTFVSNEWIMGTGLQVATNSFSVPSVAGLHDQTIHLPTQTIHGVSSNSYYEGAYSPVVTPTPYVATTGLSADYLQRCSDDQLKSWSLSPQSVPTFVAPMEAQTKTKTKKSRKKTPTNVSKGQYANADFGKHSTSKSSVAKGSRNLAKMDVRPMQQTTGKQMEATLHQTQSQNSGPSSTTQKDGKKGIKRIVVPPKVQTDPVEYPPYVARIMRILNRQKQGQLESTDDKKESEDSPTKQMTTAGKDMKGKTDSSPRQATSADKKAINIVDSALKHKEPQSTSLPSKQSALEQKDKPLSGSVVQKVNEKCSQLNSGSHKEPMFIRKTLPEDYRPVVNTALLLDDLSPDSFTLLEADNFYGPEILVTSDTYCFVVSVPFF